MAELQQRQVPKVRFLVDRLITRGSTVIVAGLPKLRKSYLTQDIGLGVATGSVVLGDLRCATADVMYLALEDSDRRIRDRTTELLGKGAWPQNFEVHYTYERGIVALGEWMYEHPGGLVVIDPLAKFALIGNSYHAQYAAMGAFNDLARRTGCTIVLVFHTTKSPAKGSPLNAVHGTVATTASVDTVMILSRQEERVRTMTDMIAALSGESSPAVEASLHVEGKDIEMSDFALSLEGAHWVISDFGIGAQTIDLTHAQDEIIALLGRVRAEEPDPTLAVSEIACRLPQVPYSSVRGALSQLVSKGFIERVGHGLYQSVDPDEWDLR